MKRYKYSIKKNQGTNYVVLDFGVFVCAACSGIHREMSHKVKGIGMSNFVEKDVEIVSKWGNEVRIKID